MYQGAWLAERRCASTAGGNDLESAFGQPSAEADLAEPQLAAYPDPLGGAWAERRQTNLRPKLYMYFPRNHGSTITCIK
jgi:hypothetical protein